MKVKQSISKELRYGVKDFERQFPNDLACLEYLKERRWPNGMAQCAKCKTERKHHHIVGRTAYSCDYCGTQIYPLVGTIFEKTSTSLKTWFYAMYLMGSTRCGISAKQIQRETGVTYKTAWRIFHQIRTLLSEGDLQLEGPTVEMDETFYGGKRKYEAGRLMRGDKRGTPVVGIVQRNGKAVARVTKNVTAHTLLGLAQKHVTPGSLIYTDEAKTYHRLPQIGFRHLTINHKAKRYVRGQVHTNSVEGLWSLLKRGIGGVYRKRHPEAVWTDASCCAMGRDMNL
jgi:transposase